MDEFFKLAATYLACRFVFMGNIIDKSQKCDWSLLGMIDYAEEMRLLINERIQERNRQSNRSGE